MKLNELAPLKGTRKNKKRVGRGPASGWGKTAGRGQKGQNCRSGGGVRVGFEGGQMPLQRRLPKRGFHNIFKKKFSIINIQDLSRFEQQSIVDDDAFRAAGLLKNRTEGIKLLGKGEIVYPLTLNIKACSRSARAKVESAGGIIRGC
ncbi:MAG: 50S ribosomal protein L15 [Desulfobacterales bacterium C00003106]|jgi:large subunit ribosomal protein L15|nr:50S ribosomal protein L15 [Deltaproteobacteria bacterium]OEU56552.1 MAG: 50S ribosomal protein L15 [Desulfobacterales bacterium C00003106]OEU59985.1 MAG: 50S ribosomal protein L15 [Desulfobacterales bacterium C00003104]